jgi:glutaredoxin
MNILIYSKTNCNFCVKAKNLLNIKNLKFTEKVLDKDFTKQQLLEILPNVKTLPQIQINGKHIGGYRELERYLNTN